MAGDAPSMGALAWRAPRPVEVGACGRAAFPGRTKRWPSPQPFPPAGEGARRHAARSSGADEPKAERSDGPCGLHFPSGRAEKRRARGGRGSAACRASCSDSLRLSERSGAAAKRVPQRRPTTEHRRLPRSEAQGTRPAGSPFFCLLFFGETKKSRSPAGANSRPAAHSTNDSQRRSRAAPHPRPLLHEAREKALT